MAVIPRLIGHYAVVFYAAGALGAFLYVWSALQARNKHDHALFELEREDAVNQGMRSWLMAGVCILVVAGVYGVENFIVPRLPEPEESDQPPSLTLLYTPTPTPTLVQPPTATPAPTATVDATPVNTLAPVATRVEAAPPTPAPTTIEESGMGGLAPACTSAGTQILAPSSGDHLSGVVEIIGTASLPNFSFYKFEIQWPGTQDWVTLQTYSQPVVGGFLGVWDTAALAGQPGAYGFRLVVVDNTGNFPEPCTISVVVE
jgi:hypothetical protein